MKRILFPLLALGLLSSLAVSTALNKVRGETLSQKSAIVRWGNDSFEVSKFRIASQDVRAKMAGSLIAQKEMFVGWDRSEVRKALGDYSGFYISGMYPTYLIQETSETSPEAWQIVFLIDANGKVKDVIIHKNCCE